MHDLYYIHKEKYEEEKDALNNEDYKKDKQTDKKPDQKEPPKKPEVSDAKEFNELINKEEMGINKELFKRFFGFQMPTAMLKALYNTVNKKKKTDLVNVIKSGLNDLRNETEKKSKD